uniref:Uncharacterized protein n=1 Tax=Arundo donax TaxID=35708 RepID=A0A0A9EIS4_ARUDO
MCVDFEIKPTAWRFVSFLFFNWLLRRFSPLFSSLFCFF